MINFKYNYYLGASRAEIYLQKSTSFHDLINIGGMVKGVALDLLKGTLMKGDEPHVFIYDI